MLREKARIGVIGTGWWATTAHLPALAANPRAILVAFADRRADMLERCAALYGDAKPYTDYQEMLVREDLDGVIVAVNHSAHYEVARAALEAGKHVMLEKPMVLKAEHAHDLMRLAEAKGVELIIGYPWNYTEVSRRAKAIMESGELGSIQFVSCLFTSMVIEFLRGNDEAYRPVFGYPVTGPGQAYADPALSGGGQGHLQVTHSAGSMFYLSDLRADVVTSFMENFDIRVDVADAIAVRFEAVESGFSPVGVVGSTGNIGVGDPGQLAVQFYCERGRLEVEHIQGTLYKRTHDGKEERFGPLPPADRYPTGATSANLVDVITGNAPNRSPAIYGVRTVELLDAAYRSAASGGQPVRVADVL